MSDICVFHHIPKTAGSALREILLRNYPGDGFIDHYGPPKPKDVAFYRQFVPTIPEGERRCLASHAAANALPVLVETGRDFRAIVVLRNPVDRVISLYWFVQTLPESNAGRGVRVAKMIRERGWSLRDIYENLGGSSPEESDLHRDFSVFFDFQSRSFVGPWRSTEQIAFREGRHDDVVEEVKGLLDRYYLAGVQDRFGEAIKRFSSAFGWSVPFRASKRKVNVGKTRPKTAEVDDETVEMIRRYNMTDMALYDLVSGS